jgi:hypothetical protein
MVRGIRGHPPADLAAIEEFLLRTSLLAEGVLEIGELDMNPVFALLSGEGCRVADTRVAARNVG